MAQVYGPQRPVYRPQRPTQYVGGLQQVRGGYHFKYGIKQNPDGAYGYDYFYQNPQTGKLTPVHDTELKQSGVPLETVYKDATKVAQAAGLPAEVLYQLNPISGGSRQSLASVPATIAQPKEWSVDGVNTGLVDQLSLDSAYQNQPSLDNATIVTGGGGGGTSPAPVAVQETQAPVAQTSTEPEAPTYQPVYWEGQLYTNPDSYREAVNRTIARNYSDQVKEIEKQWKAGLLTLDEREQAIAQTRKSLITARDSAIESQRAYFNSISPNAYQSQQKTYEDKTQQQYQEGADQVGPETASYKNLSQDQLKSLGGGLNEVGKLVRDYINLNESKDQNLQQSQKSMQEATDTNLNNYIASVAPVDASTSDYSGYVNKINTMNLGQMAKNTQAPLLYQAPGLTPEDPYKGFGGS